MTRLLVRAGSALAGRLSTCMRLGLLVGLVQALLVMLVHAGHAPMPYALAQAPLLTVILAAASTALVLSGAVLLGQYGADGLAAPVIWISVVVAGALAGVLIPSGWSMVAVVFGPAAGLAVGMALCRACDPPARTAADPDDLVSFFVAVLAVATLALAIAAVTVPETIALAVGMRPWGPAAVAGAAASAAASWFFWWRASTPADGPAGRWRGTVVGVRRSPGAEDVLAPYAADPHRVDLRLAPADRGPGQPSIAPTFWPSSAVRASATAAAAATGVFVVVVAVAAAATSGDATCDDTLQCVGPPVAALLALVSAGLVVAAIAGHLARGSTTSRHRDIDPDCSALPPGTVVSVTGTVTVVRDGSGTAAMVAAAMDQLGQLHPWRDDLDAATGELLLRAQAD